MYSEFKCFKCNKKLIGLRSLLETYWEFEVNKLGDDKFRSKVKVINALSNKINDLKKRKKNRGRRKKIKRLTI